MHQRFAVLDDVYACSGGPEWLTFTLVVHRVSLPTSKWMLWIIGRFGPLVWPTRFNAVFLTSWLPAVWPPTSSGVHSWV